MLTGGPKLSNRAVIDKPVPRNNRTGNAHKETGAGPSDHQLPAGMEPIMRYVLSVLLLHAVVPGSPAQDNEAERLFRAMENKLKSARTIQVDADIELRA